MAKEQTLQSAVAGRIARQVRRAQASFLNDDERAGLGVLVERLVTRYDRQLEKVVLFGSKARGDANDESDIDLLVLLSMPRENYRRHWNEIVDLAWDIEREFGLVLSLILKDPTDYALMRQHGLLLAQNIERDGVLLWTSKSGDRTSLSASLEQATTS